MRIEILPLDHGKRHIHEIKAGECFLFEKEFYIRLDEYGDKAFNLATNKTMSFTQSAKVIPVNSKLVVHKKEDETSYY